MVGCHRWSGDDAVDTVLYVSGRLVAGRYACRHSHGISHLHSSLPNSYALAYRQRNSHQDDHPYRYWHCYCYGYGYDYVHADQHAKPYAPAHEDPQTNADSDTYKYSYTDANRDADYSHGYVRANPDHRTFQHADAATTAANTASTDTASTDKAAADAATADAAAAADAAARGHRGSTPYSGTYCEPVTPHNVLWTAVERGMLAMSASAIRPDNGRFPLRREE
jgi:hypothetical protein